MIDKALLGPPEYADLAVDVASKKQASEIVRLDVSNVSDFTDFFVVMTAESTRQMRTLVEDLELTLKKAGATLHHREGAPQSGWRLLDFGDVIIHIFSPDEREFYLIEGAWPKAKVRHFVDDPAPNRDDDEIIRLFP